MENGTIIDGTLQLYCNYCNTAPRSDTQTILIAYPQLETRDHLAATQNTDKLLRYLQTNVNKNCIQQHVDKFNIKHQ